MASYFISFLDQFCRGVFLYAFNRQGSEKSDNSAKTTKLTRNRNGILTQKTLSPLVGGKKEANRRKLSGVLKSWLCAGVERRGVGGRTDESRLATSR